MTTDEKRREIVGNLRYCAEMCHDIGVLDSDVLNALGIHCEDTDGVSSAYDVEKLADLIDLPTCHLKLTDVEIHGNVKVRIYECSECGRPCEEIYGKYERCPHCGAVVEDD